GGAGRSRGRSRPPMPTAGGPPPRGPAPLPTRRSSDLHPRRSSHHAARAPTAIQNGIRHSPPPPPPPPGSASSLGGGRIARAAGRSEEHTSELQSLRHLVCRLLLEKKNNGRRRA